MVPQVLHHQLSRLRRRERLLQVLWGMARSVAIAIVVLGLACLFDWLVDRMRDTPMTLRVILLVAQMVLWVALGWFLIIRPLFRRMGETWLALWVEERLPRLGHRLISAIQLNQPKAWTAGMSPQLIAQVTTEAQHETADVDFASLADRRRVRNSLALLAPIALVVVVFLIICPSLVFTLVGRQFLQDLEIPRSVHLHNETVEIWPAGEEVILRYNVRGEGLTESIQGEVRLEPEGRPAERYPLTRAETVSGTEAVFTARVPPTAANFTHRARLADGRSREPGRVVFEPRPAVSRLDAWLQLPDYCGKRPDGTPFEQYQARAEIAGPAASSAHLLIQTQKPIREGMVELLGQPSPLVLANLKSTVLNLAVTPLAGLAEQAAQHLAVTAAERGHVQSTPYRPDCGPEFVLRRVPLQIEANGQASSVVFPIRAGEHAYRIRVQDRHDFANVNPTRRGVAVVPDEMPRVELLPERFPALQRSTAAKAGEVDGVPVPLGESIPIAYRCSDNFGLRTARLRYRIIKKGTSGSTEEDQPWSLLPLQEIKANEEQVGTFDVNQGVFEKSGPRDQIEFYPVPAEDANQLGRLAGGGRFDFQTRGIPGLQLGDQIEYYVEVFDRHFDPDRVPGRSETRVKTLVTPDELIAWLMQKRQHEARIRELEKGQGGVFERRERINP